MSGQGEQARCWVCAGHVMRKCAAGTVRPLGINEPLLADLAAGDSPARAQGSSAEAAPDLAQATVSEGAPCQEQTVSGRPRRKRKAAKAAIDAALQTLAEVQVRALCRVSLLSGCLPANFHVEYYLLDPLSA